MPVYEYKCKACGRELEAQQRMSDPELTDCPACGKPELERLISMTAFQLKGSGWYKDLYSSSKPDAAKSDTKAETKSDSSTSAGSSDSSSSSSASSGSSSGGSSSGGSSSGGSTGSSSGGSTSGGSSSGGGGSTSKAAAGAP